jgi:hypothetical protein
VTLNAAPLIAETGIDRSSRFNLQVVSDLRHLRAACLGEADIKRAVATMPRFLRRFAVPYQLEARHR